MPLALLTRSGDDVNSNPLNELARTTMRQILMQRFRQTTNWLRRKLLRKRVGLLAIGIGVPWLWLMWQFFGPLSAFPVSAEATIFTEPLTPQGYVDYVKIFQDRYQHPDAKPAKEDPWCLLAGILANTPDEPKGLPKFPGSRRRYSNPRKPMILQEKQT